MPTCNAGSDRRQPLTAQPFVSALGCQHVQLALGRFQQMDNRPCDLETAITSMYAGASGTCQTGSACTLPCACWQSSGLAPLQLTPCILDGHAVLRRAKFDAAELVSDMSLPISAQMHADKCCSQCNDVDAAMLSAVLPCRARCRCWQACGYWTRTTASTTSGCRTSAGASSRRWRRLCAMPAQQEQLPARRWPQLPLQQACSRTACSQRAATKACCHRRQLCRLSAAAARCVHICQAQALTLDQVKRPENRNACR